MEGSSSLSLSLSSPPDFLGLFLPAADFLAEPGCFAVVGLALDVVSRCTRVVDGSGR